MKRYICDEFIQMEYDNNLFELEVAKVKVWSYIREKIYCMIMKELGLIGDSFTDAINVIGNVENPLYKLFYMKTYKYLQFPNIEEKDYLFFTHPRRIKNGKIFECTVLDDLIEQMDGESYTIEEPLWVDSLADKLSHFYPARTKNLIYTDYIELKFELAYSLSKKFLWSTLNKKEKEKIKGLKLLLNSMFKVDIDASFEQICLKHILYEKIVRNDYRKLLDKIKPKLILEYYSPTRTKQIVNIIAHEKGIKIIDLQHGMFGRNEPLMSNYYKKGYLTNYPDYLFVFGDYWRTKSRYCLQRQNIISVGYPYFERHKIKYLNKKSTSLRNKIIFFSQGKIGHELSKVASSLAELLLAKKSEIKIIYKTHPFERKKWQNEYKWLNKINITVKDDNSSIYEYFPSALCVVGVYTTGLYEALAMGIPIFVYMDYGYEELLDLKFVSNKVHFFNNSNQILHNVEDLDYEIDEKVENYIFKNKALENIKYYIKIIENGD